MQQAPESFSESFKLTRHTKALIYLGLLFFSGGLIASISFVFLPAFNKYPTNKWIWYACTVGSSIFLWFIIKLWKLRNNSIEISDQGITAHLPQNRCCFLRWNEVISITESIRGANLTVHGTNSEKIRIEYQFENLMSIVEHLTQHLTHLAAQKTEGTFRRCEIFYTSHYLGFAFFGGATLWACFYHLYWAALLLLFTLPSAKALLMEWTKVQVEPLQITLQAVLKKQCISKQDIRSVHIESVYTSNGISALELHVDLRNGSTIKLSQFKEIVPLYLLIQRHQDTALAS